MTLPKLKAIALASLAALAGCAHGGLGEINVRAISTGRGRAFDFNPARGELVAWGNSGKLLQLWVHPGALVVGDSSHNVPEGCRAGFLQRLAAERPIADRSTTASLSYTLVEIQLCPRAGAPDGWQGWHVDFDLQSNNVTAGTLPPKLDFAVGWDANLRELRISSLVFHGAISLPDGQAPAVRTYPELFALAVVMGVVPPAPDGKYQVDKN